MHLHSAEQLTPELKHSQYFFKHSVFLQMHPPLFCEIVGWNKFGSLSNA